MRGFGHPESLPASQQFDAWLAETVGLPAAQREARLHAWTKAPHASEAHPREEHLLPLMVTAGAAGSDPGICIFSDQVMGVVVSAFQFSQTP